MEQPAIKTLGELKRSGYVPKTVKEEVRENLIGGMLNMSFGNEEDSEEY